MGAEVVVTVKDASTTLPVPLADVSLSGSRVFSGVTGKDGTVTFDGVPPGTYGGSVTKPNYMATTIPPFDVSPRSGRVVLDVTLSKVLKVVGSVRVKASPAYRPDLRSDDDPQAVSGGSLGAALAALPFVSLSPAGSPGQPISVFGHDASQSGVSVEGMPLVPTGSAANIQAIPLSLFDFAETRSECSSAAGGAVEFHVPDPTMAFSYLSKARYASYDGDAITMFARGTVGYVGFSVGHADQHSGTPWNDAIFPDQSGLTYPHATDGRTEGTVAKLRIPLSAADAVNVLALTSLYRSPDYCLYLAGLLPCGYGPGNVSQERLTSWKVSNTALIGATSVEAAVFSDVLHEGDDQGHRLFANVPEPLIASADSTVRGISLTVSAMGGKRHTLSFSGSGYRATTNGSAQVALVQAAMPAEVAGSSSAGITDDYRVSRFLRATATLGYGGVTGGASSPYGSLGLNWRWGEQQHLTFGWAAGMHYPAPALAQGFTDPSALRFDCVHSTVFGTAPSAQASPAESVSERLEWYRWFSRVELVAGAYRQILHGAIVDGYINGAWLPATTFPPGYLQAVQAVYASPFGCSGSQVLTPSDLVLAVQQPGTASYTGGSLAARLRVSPAVSVETHYTATTARPLFSLPGSTIAFGRQIVGVPLQTLDTAVAVSPHGDTFEIVADLLHVAANNPNGLPAYSIVNAGAVAHLEHGELIGSISNIFDRFGGGLGAPSNAVSVGIVGAPSFFPLAMPLPPRTVQIAYRVAVGTRPAREALSETTAQLGLSNATTFTALPLPSVPPADPFAIDTENPQCGPERAALVRPVLHALRSYLERGQYQPVEALGLGFTAVYRPGTREPSFAIAGGTPVADAALTACVSVHIGTADQARIAGVYVPAARELDTDVLFFSPRVGFYLTTNAVSMSMTSAVVRYHAFTGSPPADPFAIAPGNSCPEDVRGAATFMLSQLRDYFATYGKTASSPQLEGVEIHPEGTAVRWFSLRFDDPFVESAVEQCAYISAVRGPQAAKLGIAGDDHLDFAPAVGLYRYTP